MPNDRYYERHLPHQIPSGYPIFLTWNLKGSVPRRLIQFIEAEAKRLQREPLRRNETQQQRNTRHAKILFAKRDLALGEAFHKYLSDSQTESAARQSPAWLMHENRPMWLADPAAACEMVKSFLWGIGNRYQLWAFVVMGNHVHSLLTPSVDLEVITQGIKGFTAHEINGMHDARQRVFWQDESFDHWARDEEEMYRIIDYIEENPVVARLCQSAAQWKWSSAFVRERFAWKRGTPFPVEHQPEAVRYFESLLGR